MTRTCARWLLVLPLVTCCLMLNGGTHAEALESDGSFTVFAHRGYPGDRHTENTLASLAAARQAGARAYEVDLVLTRDRQFLAMHDVTLGRTTTCGGLVARRTLAWIREHCRGKSRHEPLPTATQLLGWVKQHGGRLILEIKVNMVWSRTDFERLHGLIQRAGLNPRVILHSFSAGTLRVAETAVPALHTQLITRDWDGVRAALPWADGVNIAANRLTSDKVRMLHRRGLYVLGRDSDNAAAWRRIRATGADGLITNQVTEAVARHQSR